MPKCSKCLVILGLDCEYRCIKCKKSYCKKCYQADEHIKNNNNYLKLYVEECSSHLYKANYYCLNCKKNVCIFCTKKNSCKNHKIKDIPKMVPDEKDINNFKEKVINKIKYVENLLDSIKEWKKSFISKINSIIINLKSEINILKKMFTNYDKYLLNYKYHYNFQIYNKYIKIINNDKFYKFYNSSIFEEKTKNIMEILFSHKQITEEKSGYLLEILKYNKNMLKLNKEYFFVNYSHKLIIGFFKRFYYKNELKQKDFIGSINESYIEFREPIYSLTSSNNKIYACLLNKKIVNIFTYDLKDGSILLSEEEIRDSKNLLSGHFNKCIGLIYDLAATIDNQSINLWKRNVKKKNYSKKFNIELNERPFDLLFINNDCFITCLNISQKINFYNNRNLEKTKSIKGIDSICSDNILFLYKEFILVNCKNGIAMLSINRKELIQYIFNLNGFNNKKLCIGNKENIYILNNYEGISIIKLKFQEGSFIPIEIYKNIKADENFVVNNEIGIIAVNNEDDLIIFGKTIYILKLEKK